MARLGLRVQPSSNTEATFLPRRLALCPRLASRQHRYRLSLRHDYPRSGDHEQPELRTSAMAQHPNNLCRAHFLLLLQRFPGFKVAIIGRCRGHHSHRRLLYHPDRLVGIGGYNTSKRGLHNFQQWWKVEYPRRELSRWYPPPGVLVCWAGRCYSHGRGTSRCQSQSSAGYGLDCYRQWRHGIRHDRDLLHDDRRCRNRLELAHWLGFHRRLPQRYSLQSRYIGHGVVVHHHAALWLRDELCYIVSSALGIRKSAMQFCDARHS